MRRWSFVAAVWLALLAGAGRAARAQSTTGPIVCHSQYFAEGTLPQTTQQHPNWEVFADVDGDGILDVVSLTIGVAVEYRNRDGSTRATATFAPPTGSYIGVFPGDIDGVAGQELVVMTESQVLVLKAGTGGTLQSLGTLDIAPAQFAPMVVVGHFRSKTQADIAVETSAPAFVLHHYASGAFTKGPTLTGVGSIGHGNQLQVTPMAIAADIDGDGYDDLLFPSADGIGIARLGTGTAWQVVQDLPTDASHGLIYDTLAAGDFDGDGRRDVIALQRGANAFMPPMRTWLQSTAGTLTAIADMPVSWGGMPVLVGDLSGDGVPEIDTGNQVGQLVAGAWHLTSAPGFNENFALVDYTGDGLLDIVGWGTTYGVIAGGRADVSVAPVVRAAPVNAGEMTTLIFTVTNNGPSPTRGLSLAASMGGTALYASDVTCGGVDCATVLLVPGQTVPISVTVRPPDGQLQLSLSACSTLIDPDAANDTASITVPVVPRADLSVVAGFSDDNGALTIGITAGNDGPSSATQVVLIVDIPSGTSGISWQLGSTPASCSLQGSKLTCMRDAFANGSLWMLTITGTLPYHGQEITVSAHITSEVTDPYLDNNDFTGTLPAVSITGGGGGLGGGSGGGGCGCALGPGAHDAGVLILAALAGIVLLAGRRRRCQRRIARRL